MGYFFIAAQVTWKHRKYGKKASQHLSQGQKTDGKRQLLRGGADWDKEPEGIREG